VAGPAGAGAAAGAGGWLRGLDIELVAFILRRRARIYDLSLEELPDEPEGTFLNTRTGCSPWICWATRPT
jgi:hypothetical protein